MAKFLLVDDELVNTQLLEKIVKNYGECICCHSGESAMKEIISNMQEKSKFDAVFLDIKMPNLDGHGFLRMLRKMESEHMLDKTIVFMVTALDDVDNVIDSFMGDCQEYLIKPVSEKELTDKLQKYGFARA